MPPAAVRTTPAPPTVEAFLAPWPAEVRDLFPPLQAVVRSAVPDAAEAVYPGWRLVGYRVPDPARKGKTHYFAFLAPLSDRVRLGFEFGALMADAARLSDGGTCRQVRFVDVRSPADIDAAWFASLLRDAAALAAGRAL